MSLGVKKKVIGELDRCYSIGRVRHKGRDCILIAAEKVNNCYLIDLEGNILETVWSEPGGVMSMVAVPNTESQFLATHKFYSQNDSAESYLVVATAKDGGKWEVKTLVDLPFVHRFDIIPHMGKNYLVACTIKSGHKFRDDWSSPGKIYIAELPENLEEFAENKEIEWKQVLGNLTKNHGYYRSDTPEGPRSIISAEDGVFLLTPPKDGLGDWSLEQILNTPASDAALIDLDGDGVDELAVIAPFHGDDVSIYRHNGKEFEKVYTYGGSSEFSHAIFAGKIGDKNTLIIGHRGGERNLILFEYDKEKGEYVTTFIDKDVGPANIHHLIVNGEDRLISTNRETNEMAMYTLWWE